MNKTRNNVLIGYANDALNNTNGVLFKGNSTTDIDSAYNGQIASLGVSIAMSGLRPALAIYYQDSSATKVNRRAVLTVIADMIRRDNFANGQITDAQSLFSYSLRDNINLNELKREVEECSIALKQVVRTYNLV